LTAEEEAELLSATTAPAQVRPAIPPAPPAPVAPARPPKPPAAPPKPREPFDWGVFWAALFSERTLTAMLGVGVLLIAVSSLVLLISLWGEFHWLVRQAFLLAQFFVFLAVGYVVKERLKLHLSGLALISVAALWVPLNVGALVFEFMPAPAERLLPGIDLPLDLPMAGWLIIAATCVPIWAALTYRFKGHLLTHGTVAAVGATVALLLAVLGVPWEWSVAALAVLTIPLLFTWQYLRQTSFRVIAEPLFWTAQAILLGVTAVLLVAWALGEAGSYPLAVVGVAGTALYVAAHRFSPNLAYEYMFAGLPVIALLFALTEGGILPLRYYDALLMGVSIVYIIVARRLEKKYQVALLRSSQWPVLQPAYAVGYLLVMAAVVWYPIHEVSRLGVLYGATAVTLVSARWSGRVFWTYLASLLLPAAFLLTLSQVDQLPLGYWSVALGVLAWVYMAGGVALRRAPGHALPLFIGMFALSVASLAWAASTADLAVLSLALPVGIGTYAAAALLTHRGIDVALSRLLGYALWLYWGTLTLPDEQVVRRWGSVLFMAMAAALAPAWTTLARLWADIPALWIGLDFMALAFLYTFVGYRLTRLELRIHARVILTLGALLVIAAPIYHSVAVAGSSWV